MRRGRPIGSEIRQNIIDILFQINKGYGYQIYCIYREIFPKATMRVIYYHLKKGEILDEIKTFKIMEEKGDYSWGDKAQKIYYSLGKKANPRFNKKIEEYIKEKKKLNKNKHKTETQNSPKEKIIKKKKKRSIKKKDKKHNESEKTTTKYAKSLNSKKNKN